MTSYLECIMLFYLFQKTLVFVSVADVSSASSSWNNVLYLILGYHEHPTTVLITDTSDIKEKYDHYR